MTTGSATAAASGSFALGGDIEVHRLGFGAMRTIGPGVWGPPADREAALAVLRRLPELDVQLVDTADAYGPGDSEELIAEALHPYPDGLVVATKGGCTRGRTRDWGADGRPDHLKAACEGSLTRLRVERIDLYQLHTVDPNVAIEDSVGALADLRSEGKIRHVGLSNVDVDELDRARSVLPVAAVQNRYSLSDRSSEDVLERCAELGIAFLPYFPLAAGRLADASGPLARIAEAHEATTAQVALAWLLARSPVVLPIPGTSSLAHLEENVAAAAIELAEEELAELDRASA